MNFTLSEGNGHDLGIVALCLMNVNDIRQHVRKTNNKHTRTGRAAENPGSTTELMLCNALLVFVGVAGI